MMVDDGDRTVLSGGAKTLAAADDGVRGPDGVGAVSAVSPGTMAEKSQGVEPDVAGD